jgi:hypothetical protein
MSTIIPHKASCFSTSFSISRIHYKTNFPVLLGSRSLHGCWTCRLRRKKCDESQPSCSACVSYKLMCYGYGSKPKWMDGGKLEREQAIEVKRIVKEAVAKKRLYRMASKMRSPGHSRFEPPLPLSESVQYCPPNFLNQSTELIYHAFTVCAKRAFRWN